jgi:H+/Cl- antiporter ClcA
MVYMVHLLTDWKEKIPAKNKPHLSPRIIVLSVLLFFAAALAMVAFLGLQTVVTDLIWQEPAYSPLFILLLTILGGLAVGLCLQHFGNHVTILQKTMIEFEESGRFEPKYLPGGLLAIFLSLIFGASLGPEMAAVDMGGGMGTWTGERRGSEKERVRRLSIIGIAGALVGFGIFLEITATTSNTLYPVPLYQQFILGDLLLAAILGLVGGLAGIAMVYCYRFFSHVMEPLAEKHVLRGLLGGIGLGLAGIAAPLVLFSGQYQFQTVLVEGAALGAATLVFMVVVKILASTWCMATVFKGGPIFPLIFSGGTLGMAISLFFPVIPMGVAIAAVMAGMIVCILKSRVGVILLLLLVFYQWGLFLVIIIATIAGYLITKKVRMVPLPRKSGEQQAGEGSG